MKCKIAFTPQGNDRFFFLVAHGRFCETCKFFVQIFVCIWNAFFKSQFYAYLFQRPSRSSNSMLFKCNITAEKERPLSVHLRPLENCQKFGYIPGQICTSNYTVTCIFLCLDSWLISGKQFQSHYLSAVSHIHHVWETHCWRIFPFALTHSRSIYCTIGSDREVHSNIIDLFLKEKIV